MAADLPADGDAAPTRLKRLKLQHLQQRFRAGLAGRACELRAAASRVELHDALHRLVGAAGSYGEEALALQARQALNLLHGAGPADLAAAAQAVALLCEHCDARAAEAAADGC